MDYCKLSTMVMAVVALPEVVSLEQSSITHGTKHVVINLADAFFLFQLVRKIRANTNLNFFAPGLCPLSCNVLYTVLRILDHLHLLQDATPVHYTEDRMQWVLISMQQQARGWKISGAKVHWAADTSTSRGLVVWGTSG